MKNFFYTLVALVSFASFAQNDWKVEYSKSKTFIENLGQFDRFENDFTGDIKYAVDFGFTKIFFGEKGVSYSFLKVDKKSKDERKKLMEEPSRTFENHKQKEKLMGKFLVTEDEVNMTWSNLNSKVEIIGNGESSSYHSYSFTGEDGEVKNINFIKSFETITYRNVYPKIDVQYQVHPEIGIKYAFIVHPGADLSKLQMLYDRQISLIDYEIHINTLFGDIIDHAPITFYQDNQDEIIASEYVNKNNQISFKLGDFDQNRTIVIDPWVQTPNDPNSNWDCVWELDHDAVGNVYVIAGIMPMQLLKYNSAGALQWTHNTPYDTTAWLGTMATDNVGNTYVTNGTDYKIQKINTAGGLVWNNNSPSGGQISTEFWNISFNCDQTKLLIGGTGGNLNIHGRVYDVDMNSGNINSSVQVTQAGNLFSIPPNIQEVRAMCAAPNGKYYFVTLDTIGYLSDNLTLCPNGSSSLVMDDHGIGWGYKSENWRYNNTGIKAIRADANFVYVHRGNILQKRSLVDFSIIGTVNIPGGTLQSVFLGGNQSHNAGIDIDQCGNIYVGSTTGVYAFNSALTQIGFYPTSFKVWDVQVSAAGDIIACGGSGTSSTSSRTGGVQSFAAAACAPLAYTCCDATVCIPQDMCVTDAPITLTPSTPGGTWSGLGVDALGNFDPAVAGIGTTNITYSLLCGSETISFTIDPCATIDICEEGNGDLTASGGDGNYSWYQGTITTSSVPITTEQECIDCPTTTPNYFFGIYTGCSGSTCSVTDTTWTLYSTGTTTSAPAGYPIQIVDGQGTATIINNAGELVPCTITPCTGVTITMNVDSQTEPSCFGGSNGTATVSSTGGTAPYSYFWTPGSLTGASQTGLSAGVYNIAIQDNAGCTGSGTVTITEPAELIASASSTPASCGLNDGTATGSATGGTGAYSYSWSPSGGTNAVATGLGPNTYTVTVTDINGCTDDAVVNVTNTGGPTISLDNSSNVSCFGANDGTATVSATGGTPGYTYSWMPGSLSGATQNALGPNSYTVTVSDAGGCTDLVIVDITEPTQIVLSTSNIISANCGANDGGATVDATGGTGNYSYSWSPVGGSGATASGVPGGAYTVTVTDDSGCSDVINFNIPTTSGPTINVDAASNVSCFGANDGSATVSATGGTPAYSYSWMPGSLSGATQGSLAPNSYTVTVTDAGGCTDQVIIDILEPTQIQLSTSNIISASCGANDGGATVDATGGTGNYTYAWSPAGGIAATASGVPGGAYTVTVTDDSGCSEVINFTIPNTSGPTISLDNFTDVSCFGANDGTAAVSATGGTPGYTYDWAPGALTGANQAGLGPNSYTVTVTDGGGCTNQIVVNIAEPSQIQLSTSNIISANCGANDGGATVDATGGTGVYTYAWSPVGGTAAFASGIPGGSYTVTVTDDSGCSEVINFTIPTTGGPTINVLSTNDATCFGATDGDATIEAVGGTSPYSYSWSPSGGTAASAVNLGAGTYTVTVTDAGGCISVENVIIGEPSEIIITEVITNENCGQDDGSISIVAAGGNPGYTYAWTPNGETSSSITGLSAGNFGVTVTDASGCTAAENYNVIAVGGIPVNVTPTSATINTGESVQLTATGADTYVWSPIDGLSCTTCSDPIATPTVTTTYIVTGTDASGCSGSDTVTIFVTVNCGDIYVPNIFSPNTDMNNDYLCVYGSCVADLQFKVYDRWGEMVFSTEGTINMNPGKYNEVCWDGKFRDKLLNSGVYAYSLYARLTNGEVVERSGNITLVR